MNSFKHKLLLIGVTALSYAPSALAAAPPPPPSDLEKGASAAKPSGAGTPTDLTNVFGTIANILIFITGAISVIIIIFGGLRYVTSTGDAGRVKQAKDTIQYAIIGLVVSILAYAIVNFVVDNLT
jgi:hypothetical protein